MIPFVNAAMPVSSYLGRLILVKHLSFCGMTVGVALGEGVATDGVSVV
jgi:hypothetical protein